MPRYTVLTPVQTPESYYSKNRLSVQAQRKARRNGTVRGRMNLMLDNARQRAKKSGWGFDLTLDFLCALWEEQEGLCAITKQPLGLQTQENRISSSLVSIDRIDSEGGYTQDNIWLVQGKVNYAKGTQDYEGFVEMCKQVVENYNA